MSLPYRDPIFLQTCCSIAKVFWKHMVKTMGEKWGELKIQRKNLRSLTKTESHNHKLVSKDSWDAYECL